MRHKRRAGQWGQKWGVKQDSKVSPTLQDNKCKHWIVVGSKMERVIIEIIEKTIEGDVKFKWTFEMSTWIIWIKCPRFNCSNCTIGLITTVHTLTHLEKWDAYVTSIFFCFLIPYLHPHLKDLDCKINVFNTLVNHTDWWCFSSYRKNKFDTVDL